MCVVSEIKDTGHEVDAVIMRILDDVIEFRRVLLVHRVVEIHTGFSIHCSRMFRTIEGKKLVAVDPNTHEVGFAGQLVDVLFVIVNAIRFFIDAVVGSVVPSHIGTDGEEGTRLSPAVGYNLAFQIFCVGHSNKAFSIPLLAVKG